MHRTQSEMQLNQQQREAVEHGTGPLLIVAGAGTGKTTVIVERVVHLLTSVSGLQPEHILALTFTNKAAEEMHRRIVDRLGERGGRCRFSTFHAFCYGLLRGELPLRALDEIDQWIFLRRHLEELELDYYLKVSEPGRFLEDLVKFCSHCHDNLVSPADYRRHVEQLAADFGPSAPQTGKSQQEIARLREVARVYERSEELQAREGLLSFGAMISQVVARLKDSPEWLRELRRRYAYILVDEFQDTNAAQWELLKLLGGERRNVAVVGDDYQAIYRFRGAADGSLEQFETEDFKNCKRIGLHRNYRSTSSILMVADAAIAKDEGLYRREKQLVASNPAGRKIEVWEFGEQRAQAEFVAAEIARQVHSGKARGYSDFAVLYRAHRHRDRLVAALRSQGVPFAIRNLAVNNLPPVRDLVAYLRSIGQPHDTVSLLRVLTDPRWGIDGGLTLDACRQARAQRLPLRAVVEESAATPQGRGLSKVLDLLNRFRNISETQRMSHWLELLRQELGLPAQSQYGPPLRAFSEFVGQWDREKSATGLLQEFLEYFLYFEEAGGTIILPEKDAESSQETGVTAPEAALTTMPAAAPLQGSLWAAPRVEEPPGKVQLMTIHAAKGLEFENVFLLHLVRGAFPVRYRRPLISLPTALWRRPLEGDMREIHLKEERRLFYVGLTRAKRTLTLCTISNDRQRPSRFLEELRDCPEMEWKQMEGKKAAVYQEAQQAPADCSGAASASQRFFQIAASAARPGAPPAAEFSLSVSALETYRQCPLKYQFAHVWRIPVPTSPAMLFGSIVHGAVKEVVRRVASDPASFGKETLEAILRGHWSDGFSDAVQARKYWETGLRQLEGVCRTWSTRPFQLLYQEKPFELIQAGTRMAGRIDQINRIAGREVELIEYKTGRPQTKKEADESLQLTLYARACREALGLEPRTLILYNLETQEAIRSERKPGDFQELEETVRDTAREILAGRFPARPGYLCRYCDFRAICPAQEDSGWEAAGPA